MSLQDYRDSIEPELILPLTSEAATDLKPATYVTSRTSSTWRSSSADGVTSNGVIRVTIAAENAWLCPETIRVQMTVNNLATEGRDLTADEPWAGLGTRPGTASVPALIHNDLQPAGGGAGFFSRVRVLAAGTLIEDISDYGRLSEMFLSLSSEDKVLNQDISDFPSVALTGNFHNTTFKKGIPGGKARTVSFPLSVCGIFNTIRHIPLRHCPIVLECVIAPASVCLAQGDISIAYTVASNELDVPQVNQLNNRSVRRSQLFSITNFQIKGDLVTLDSGVDESLKASMMNGNKMTLRLPTYTTDSMNLQSLESTTLMMSRSLSSIRAVWVTFFAAGKSAAGYRNAALVLMNNKHMSEVNSFHTPKQEEVGGNQSRACYGLTMDEGDLTCQLAIGSKLFPDYPMTGPSEQYESLLRAMGVHASNHTSTSLRATEYRTGDRFILAWNLERAPSFAALTGLPCTNGENIQVRLSGMTNAYTNANPIHQLTKAFVTLEHDIMVEISASGVSVKS